MPRSISCADHRVDRRPVVRARARARPRPTGSSAAASRSRRRASCRGRGARQGAVLGDDPVLQSSLRPGRRARAPASARRDQDRDPAVRRFSGRRRAGTVVPQVPRGHAPIVTCRWLRPRRFAARPSGSARLIDLRAATWSRLRSRHAATPAQPAATAARPMSTIGAPPPPSRSSGAVAVGPPPWPLLSPPPAPGICRLYSWSACARAPSPVPASHRRAARRARSRSRARSYTSCLASSVNPFLEGPRSRVQGAADG